MTLTTTRIGTCGAVFKVTYDENHTITDVTYLDIYDETELAEHLIHHLLDMYADDPQRFLDEIAKREAGLDPY